MSTSYKVAIAIDKDFWPEVEPFIKDIPEGYESYERETPDNTYLCIYWDEIAWDRPETRPLQNVLENIRHSMIVINKDLGKIESDVLTDDEWGCDGEFYEILSWSADISFWEAGSSLSPIYPYSPRCGHCIPVSKDRIVRILSEYVTNDLSATEDGYIYDALSLAGASHEEMEALGFGYCIPEDE